MLMKELLEQENHSVEPLCCWCSPYSKREKYLQYLTQEVLPSGRRSG